MPDVHLVDITIQGLQKIASIVSKVGLTTKSLPCGELCCELLIIATYLESPAPRLIDKIHRDIEKICWSPKQPDRKHPVLRALGSSTPSDEFSIEYQNAERQAHKGFQQLSQDTRAINDVITHFRKLGRFFGDRLSNGATALEIPDSNTIEDTSDRLNIIAYNAIRDQMYCSCGTDGTTDPGLATASQKHLSCLLLKITPSPNEEEKNFGEHFELIFSSERSIIKRSLGHWKDVRLIIPRNQTTLQGNRNNTRNVTFAVPSPEATPNTFTLGPTADVARGEFCSLIGSDAHARLCLTVQGTRLLRYIDSEIPNQFFDCSPCVPLATVLDKYHLKPRVKAALACMLACSVWYFYQSDWMNTRWTKDTIQFAKTSTSPTGQGDAALSCRPYVAIQFGDHDPGALEASTAVGDTLRYPRIRALGIMLVEIGMGSSLQDSRDHALLPDLKRANTEVFTARRLATSASPCPDFDYPAYWSAARKCLDSAMWASVAFDPGASDEEQRRMLKKRRALLYKTVVSPLRDLLRGTGWDTQLTDMGYLELKQQPKARTWIKESAAPVRASGQFTDQKRSEEWLKQINAHRERLKKDCHSLTLSRRIRIAILDTGYDPQALFFHPPFRQRRLAAWKDFAGVSQDPEDLDGHGTYIMSLIMQIAPEADIFMARISKDEKGLAGTSSQVAEAIRWAQEKETCGADIISMSFGYSEDQKNIEHAILDALRFRDQRVLFFGAASNFGANEPEMFPARSPHVISIRATNYNGHFHHLNPPRASHEASVLGTLGLDVPSAGHSCQPHHMVYKDGSSVATAVAAGVAGILLEYVRGQSSERLHDKVSEGVQKMKGMRQLLMSLSSQPSGQEGCHYLTLWPLNDKDRETRWAFFVQAVHN